jgi:hypothetical protein
VAQTCLSQTASPVETQSSLVISEASFDCLLLDLNLIFSPDFTVGLNFGVVHSDYFEYSQKRGVDRHVEHFRVGLRLLVS